MPKPIITIAESPPLFVPGEYVILSVNGRRRWYQATATHELQPVGIARSAWLTMRTWIKRAYRMVEL